MYNYERAFIENKTINTILSEFGSTAFSKEDELNQIKISTNGLIYTEVRNEEEKVLDLVQKILALSVSETRDYKSATERIDFVLQDASRRDGPFISISFNSGRNQYFINGDFLPKSLVDPSRTFEILDPNEAKIIVDVLNQLLNA